MNRSRNSKIKEQIDRDRVNTTIEKSVATASEDFNLTTERVSSIYYGKTPPVSRLSKEVSDEREPSNELLIEVARETTKVLAILLQESDKGERLRTRLNLKGFKEWDKPTEEHEGIAQDVQRYVDTGLSRTRARMQVAKESQVGDASGYTYENVKRIDQRKLKRLKQDVQELVDSEVPYEDAIAIIAKVFDIHIDRLR